MANDKDKNPKSSTGKQGVFVPNAFMSRGDIITSDQGGWWVCMNAHTTNSKGINLKPGQSNDNFHWSTGPS